MNAQQWPANTAANVVEGPGVTPPPDGPRQQFLSDAMVAHGLVTPAQMTAALEASRTGGRYSEILVDSGVISEDDLARIIAAHYRMDHVDLDRYPVDPEAVGMVSRGTARRLGAVPIAQLDTGELLLAVHDPESLTNTVEVSELLGREIRPVVASRTQIERLIQRPPADPPPPEPPVAYIGPPQPESAQLREELERRLAEAEARAERAELRVAELQRRLTDAERHAEGMLASAQAANEALAQLAKASAAPAVPPPPPPSTAPPGHPAAPPTAKARGLRRMIAALRRS